MTCVRRKGGYKIKLEDGRIFPKLYKTLSACRKRVGELRRHSKRKKK